MLALLQTSGTRCSSGIVREVILLVEMRVDVASAKHVEMRMQTSLWQGVFEAKWVWQVWQVFLF